VCQVPVPVKVAEGAAQSGKNVYIRQICRNQQDGCSAGCESVEQCPAEKEAGKRVSDIVQAALCLSAYPERQQYVGMKASHRGMGCLRHFGL
jgi:hypothetical protein